MRLQAALLAALLAACGGDDDAVITVYDAPLDSIADAIVRYDAPVGDPRGGWQMGTAWACFSPTFSANFAASRVDVASNPCCSWNDLGYLYYPNNMGTWTLDALDRLVVPVDPPCGDACGPVVYDRVPDLTCAF